MEQVILRSVLPCALLQSYVRQYQVYRFSFDKEIVPPVKFHTPRPEHSITFYVRDPQKFSLINSATVNAYPQCVINGMLTIPLNRHGGHDFCAIKVVLQPTTLSRLKIVQVNELNNSYINAEDFLGRQVSVLSEQLLQMNEIEKMLGAIEHYLIQLVTKRCKTLEPIDKVSQLLVKQERDTSLAWLANQSCLSVRQFIRRFEEHIGVSPKMFQKLVRFDRAYRMKNSNPNTDWLYIALACGYYDYQHMAKDFKILINITPANFYEIEKTSTERFFGLHEG